MMKLVEDATGIGELSRNQTALRGVRYEVRRFQGMVEGSGLPIPGLFRIEGAIQTGSAIPPEWLNIPLTLRLEDGRSLGVVVVDDSGKILSEGHGPMKCMCC
jgi:hypothetical protein